MRAALLIAPSLALIAACSDGSSDGPRLDLATPDYGPLVGGTRIVLSGARFGDDVRVLIAGREAPLAHATDDTTVEVVIPPGERPGDAELVVLGKTGTATSAHLFHYSMSPTIDAVSPAEVVFTSTTTQMTVTGRGFLDDGAGEVSVLVDGTLATDVAVIDDTTLTFTAPPGQALVQPDVVVADQRGRALRSRSFRYRPAARGGLLLFNRYGDNFAVFFDPVDNTTVGIPRVPTAAIYTAVVVDDRGDYWGVDRSRRFGRIDMRTQSLEAPLAVTPLMSTMVRVGSDHIAIDRLTRKIGVFDPATGAFAPIGTTALTCCGSYGIAYDGTTLWFTTRSSTGTAINSFDRTTGAIGTPVEVAGGFGIHIEEMRVLGGVLYATSTDETLLTIDPTTGVTTTLPVAPGRSNAMEIIQ
ncbi:hypothetical protein BH11MYX3_BH11MYX3_19600 [soil metagenome]